MKIVKEEPNNTIYSHKLKYLENFNKRFVFGSSEKNIKVIKKLIRKLKRELKSVDFAAVKLKCFYDYNVSRLNIFAENVYSFIILHGIDLPYETYAREYIVQHNDYVISKYIRVYTILFTVENERFYYTFSGEYNPEINEIISSGIKI